jgi:alginate O-acetyltransferase complex protein AlgI
MLFNSFEFLIFFLIVTLIFFLLRQNLQQVIWLLIASCYFYMAFVPAYILILLLLILIDYFAGIWIEKAKGITKKNYLIISLIANISLLVFFKYFNFLNENLYYLVSLFGIHYIPAKLNIVLPIGLSFHTFQSMSYTLEVYRGNQRAERNLGVYALYVLFYPQMVAGPIERPQNLLHQFKVTHSFTRANAAAGLRLMCWGLFKKVVIADRLAVIVNQVYQQPQEHGGLALVLATYFFAFQIYCDFSGYSDIAIGAARVMGYELMTNFNRPYLSTNISQFWQRWHISLSTWFRDYLYISLGGNRVSVMKWQLNTLIVFLISGLWHGANWTFVCWGLLHGVYLVIYNLTKRYSKKLQLDKVAFLPPYISNLINGVLTFHLVAFAWIFFRANSLSDAAYVITHLANGVLPVSFTDLSVSLGMPVTESLLAMIFILLLVLIEAFIAGSKTWLSYFQSSWGVRWATYSLMLLIIIVFGVFDAQSFIYFQF